MNTTITYQNIFIALFLSVGLLLTGCATTKMTARPSEGATTTPNGTFSIVGQEGVVISAAYTTTPYKIKGITTFFVEVFNNTANTIEFLPKPYLLFDQSGSQYLAMGPNAISEAASSGSYRNGYYSFGFGYGPYGTFHSHSLMYGYPGYYEPYYFTGRKYQGMIAKALPVRPITIHPHAKISGNVYFAVNPKSLQTAELVITRMAQMPHTNEPPPRDIEYRFPFDVVN